MGQVQKVRHACNWNTRKRRKRNVVGKKKTNNKKTFKGIMTETFSTKPDIGSSENIKQVYFKTMPRHIQITERL